MWVSASRSVAAGAGCSLEAAAILGSSQDLWLFEEDKRLLQGGRNLNEKLRWILIFVPFECFYGHQAVFEPEDLGLKDFCLAWTGGF